MKPSKISSPSSTTSKPTSDKLQNAQALRQSILRHAFTGKLVPQDPNDEPASELLKRIAAERERAPAKRRREASGRTHKWPAAPAQTARKNITKETDNGRIADRQTGLELRRRVAGRRAVLLRVRRAAHAAALPQDGGPAHRAALQPRADRAAGTGLEGAAAARRRGAGGPIPRDPRKARREARHARRHLQGRPLRDPQPGAAQAAHRQPHRQGGLAQPAGGREGHDLRGIAAALGAGIFTRRGPVLHARGRHPDDVRGHAADAGGPHLRPGGRHRRLPVQRLPVRARAVREGARSATRSGRCARSWSRAWNFRPRSAACAR